MNLFSTRSTRPIPLFPAKKFNLSRILEGDNFFPFKPKGSLFLKFIVIKVGLLGAFAALMVAAFISTHDTYLHSWATILVQDVIMPFREKPFDRDTHLKVLRYAILGVAVFIFFFSLLFQQNLAIALFFAITAAIFAGGSGAVIIGGLYWDRGTTKAAWTAIIIGALISVSGVLVKQISVELGVIVFGVKF